MCIYLGTRTKKENLMARKERIAELTTDLRRTEVVDKGRPSEEGILKEVDTKVK
jgi:hypothetical protein